MHGEFFKIISQIPEYVKAFCRNNPLLFECRNWICYNQSK